MNYNHKIFISGGQQLAAFSSSGELLWVRQMAQTCSAPLALAGGNILINGRGSSYLLDERGGQVREIGSFGYDVLPPAVLSSGEIAVAGYAYTGACLVDESGKILWRRPDFEDADSLVTANKFSEIAFGNLNDEVSLVVSSAGRDLFKVPFSATFSEHPSGWISCSEGQVRLLSRTGSTLWEPDSLRLGF